MTDSVNENLKAQDDVIVNYEGELQSVVDPLEYDEEYFKSLYEYVKSDGAKFAVANKINSIIICDNDYTFSGTIHVVANLADENGEEYDGGSPKAGSVYCLEPLDGEGELDFYVTYTGENKPKYRVEYSKAEVTYNPDTMTVTDVKVQ